MAAKLYSTLMDRVVIGHDLGTSGSRSNLSLNAAYVPGTSGPAFAVRYVCPAAVAINELYIFMDAFTGTLGNITMACDIYNEHASTATQPGSTLRDSSTATAMPNAVDKWIKFTFGTPYSPTVGEILWLVCHNTAAVPLTDFPQILITTITEPGFYTQRMVGVTTSNGFLTGGTTQFEAPFVVNQGSDYFGQPITNRNNAFYASSTLKRGIVVSGITEDVSVAGIVFGITTAASGVQIFTSTQAPGDTPIYSFALGTDANESRDEVLGYKHFDTPITLVGGTDYLMVITFGSASAGGRLQIEDYASYPTVFDSLLDGFVACYAVIDNGAGGWTYDKNILPSLALILAEFVAASGGGGISRARVVNR